MAWYDYDAEGNEYWEGDDGSFYSKDPYGNVYDQAGFPIGNDAPYQQPYQQPYQNPYAGGAAGAPYAGGGAYSYLGPFSISNPGQPSYVSPGFPMTNQLAGMGMGDMGLGAPAQGQPQYNWRQDQNAIARENLSAEIQKNQAYQQYLNQQLAQQGRTAAEQAAIQREKLAIDRQLAALAEQKFALEKEADLFKRGMTLTETLANPRNLVQSLMLLGGNPAQVAGYLQNQPFTQQVGAPAGVGQQPGWAPPPGGATLENVQAMFGGLPSWQQILQSTSAAGGGGTIDPATGRNTLFPFIEGKKLPVQQTLQDIASGSQRTGVISSLAGFSGQNPESFFGEFESYLPKGSTMMPGGYR